MKVHITWEKLSKALGLDYDGPDEFSVMDQASSEARQWLKEYADNNDLEVDDISEEAQDEVRFAIEQAISDHWSVQHVLDRVLDLDGLVHNVNVWCRRGPQMQIYSSSRRKLHGGNDGVHHVQADDGVYFFLSRPFLVAYIEAVYCVEGFGDEGANLRDMDGYSVAATMRRISECEGNKIKLDLNRWDEQRSHPTYQDLEKVPKAASKSS